MKLGIPIILADLQEVIFIIVMILAGIFKFISFISDSKKKAPEPRPRQQPRPKAPVVLQEMKEQREAARAGRPAEDNVRSEVEDFLRRVRQQGEGEQRPAQVKQSRRPRIEVLVEDSGEEVIIAPKRPGAPNRQRPLPSKQAEIAATERRDLSASKGSPSAQPPLERRHLAEGRVLEHASHLGEELGQTDERMVAHLHQKFDHQLGNLGGRETSSAEQIAVALAVTPAEDIAALLATPQGMQQAIILSEIIQRPTERW